MLTFAAERLMSLEVEALTGAPAGVRSAERLNHRNGYHERAWDTRRKVLGIATGASEAEPFWTAFLRSLADRGLRGVKLVIADDHKGLRAATRVFHASLQRCRVHWMRNAMAHFALKQRPAVVAMLKTIFAQDTAEAAREQWSSVAEALRERCPKLSELMDRSREEVLVYMTLQSPLKSDKVPVAIGRTSTAR
jgi:transposase-like protein